MALHRSSLYKLGCYLIYPPGTVESILDDELLLAYQFYHLGITPNVPVVLFQLSTLNGVGSPVYAGTCSTIYHLPPNMYDEIEDVIVEGAYCVSESFYKCVVETDAVGKSIFSQLEKIRQAHGLNVIGIFNETQ